jgi:bifunctional non-homologous end joining protein LigD
MGLEGMVSKLSDRPYRAGRSRDWIKVKNRKHPAASRVMDAFSSSGPSWGFLPHSLQGGGYILRLDSDGCFAA